MAIIGPADLPAILKIDSDPIKAFALTRLGHPNVLVEILESQWEIILRTAGDFISGYFPLEEKFAYFYTQPLVNSYPLPKDAYWVKQVAYDPAVSRIDDIFSAESFLFCLDPLFKILDKDNKLQPLGDWKNHWKAKTPYGDRKLQTKTHKLRKSIPKLVVKYNTGYITATVNHVVMTNRGWRQLDELKVGDMLSGVKNKIGVQKLDNTESNQAISVRAINAGAYYGCHEGEPILLH